MKRSSPHKRSPKSAATRVKPRVIVFSGYGLNCEEETTFACELAGAVADIVHVNDVIAHKKLLDRYQIMVMPGGFSYGDDTGSGKAYANKLKNTLMEPIRHFVDAGKLVIGICNGFQILTNLGLLPGALAHNAGGRFIDRWVDLKPVGQSPWLAGIESLSLPIAHGEGRYVADQKTLTKLKREGSVAFEYVKGETAEFFNLPANPNGATANIAGVLDETGRVLGMMPHPERGIRFTQLPHWTYIKDQLERQGKPVPAMAGGIEIFHNAVRFFGT